MTKRIPTKSTPTQKYQDYLKKGEGFFKTMSQLYLAGNWNSTALEGIHSAILVADAILIFSRGYKSSSKKHSDVETLIADLPLEGAKEAAQHLSKILNVENLVEYSGDSYLPEEAKEIVKQVERFLNWARKILPKQS